MKQTRILMGMPITIEVVENFDDTAGKASQTIDGVFDYFTYVDNKFSTYKDSSEISLINQKQITFYQASADMKLVFALADQTKHDTDGYFDISRNGSYDPSGIVKGWAIYNAAALLRHDGFRNFYVEAGGDIQAEGNNAQGQAWQVGIRNPFNPDQIVKVLSISNTGVATSGSYIRGQHIYNPKQPDSILSEIVSLTVIGPNIYEADRFATAAFAMGREGIVFIETLTGFEGYMIDNAGLATLTSGFERFVTHDQVH
ncbi:MAG: FAD:protein FMN transferase [Chloroflexota bacterium]